jgi:heptosyltransferase I
MSLPNNGRLGILLKKEDLKILVVVRDHMSGLLYSVPSLRYLRQTLPGAKIFLLANPFASPILKNCPYIDVIIPFYQFREHATWFDKVKLFADKAQAFLSLYKRVDLVIHLRYVGDETLVFCELLGKPFQVGYSQGKFDHFLDINLGGDDASLDSRTRNARILESIGIKVSSQEMQIWITPSETNWSENWLQTQGWHKGESIIMFHPGCHWGCNEWLVERWAELGNEVYKRFQCKIIITGTASERPMVERIAQELDVPPIIAAGETTLLHFAALLKKAMAVISVDTAPTQICQALKKPAVILMGAGNPAWNGPLAGEPMIMLQKLSQQENAVEFCNWSAGFCHSSLCSSRLKNISVSDVLLALERVLSTNIELVNI